MICDAPEPAVWFPTVRAGTGADVFTTRLCEGLNARGIRAQITWLPHRAEYLPWSVRAPHAPSWANIVHANTWLHARFLPSGLPLVLTMHLCVHDPALAPYKSLAQALYHRIWISRVERDALHRADRIVAVSRYTRDRTERAFGMTAIEVIPNGVPIPPDLETLPDRQPHSPFRLLYVGNWSTRKGVDMLGPIMESLGPGFELRYTADAHGRHRKGRLPANCRCIGRLGQRELRNAYREADALLFPSRLEGLPLTVMEAMVNGLPVVAANASSLPEVLRHGVGGYLCPMDDAMAFASAIRQLAANRRQWRRCAEGAALDARQQFDVNGSVEAYLAVYRKTLDLGIRDCSNA